MCHLVYQTGFHDDEKDSECSWVDSESIENSSEEDLLLPPRPSPSQLLSSGGTAAHVGNSLL